MSTLRVPFAVGPTGRIGQATDQYDIANQYLKTLLLTRLQERIMRPTYGSGVRDAVFEPISETLFQEMQADIIDAIRSWEPAVTVRAVEFNDAGSLLEIDVVYSLNSTIGLPPTRLSVSIDIGGAVEETSS